MRAKQIVLVCVCGLLVGCGTGCDGDKSAAPAPRPVTAVPIPTRSERPSAGSADQSAGSPRVVFLGDSLTAGLGLEADQAFPALVGRALAAEGLPVQPVNAGVSGDTTAGGLRRLDWVLRQKPDVVVVGLGGNDGLRGTELRTPEENLRAIVQKCRSAGASVLLLGMQIPPSYGPEYAQRFRDIFPRLARELDVPLVPFMLEGVGGRPEMNLPDGIHPTAEGHRRVAENVLPQLRDIVRAKLKGPEGSMGYNPCYGAAATLLPTRASSPCCSQICRSRRPSAGASRRTGSEAGSCGPGRTPGAGRGGSRRRPAGPACSSSRAC